MLITALRVLKMGLKIVRHVSHQQQGREREGVLSLSGAIMSLVAWLHSSYTTRTHATGGKQH